MATLHALARANLLRLQWFFALLLTSGLAFAQDQSLCVEPSEEVITAVVVRQHASTDSPANGRLTPGGSIQVVGEVPHWYRVLIEDGADGFVSKAWTELRPCVNSGAGRDFQIDVVDVGTGLSVFVRGEDFALLYDGGSNDDLGTGANSRLLAWLAAAHPDLERIDHVVVSHAHRDHIELLPDIFLTYEVGNLWHSGALGTTCGFRALMLTAAQVYGLRLHTGATHYGPASFDFPQGCRGSQATASFDGGGRITTEPIRLGQDAWMQFLYIDSRTRSDPNRNSLVMRLDLAGYRALFMGDADGGSRDTFYGPPQATSIEGILTSCCQRELRADLLIVGHHGSKTSSRAAFLDAVGARDFVISSGPFRYGSVTLPDQDVVDELVRRGRVWRTDLDDVACREQPEKIGRQADGRVGGCHNIQIAVGDEVVFSYSP